MKAIEGGVNIFDETDEIVQLNHGHIRTFETIYNRYHQRIYGNILRLVHSPEYAEEILQDVFVTLWQNRYKISKDQPIASWLFVVSYNKAMDFLKKKVRDHISYIADYEPYHAHVDNSSEQLDLIDQQIHILEEAVDHLPPRKREVFRLCRYEGHSKEAVAEMLDISANSVSDYLKQANQSIKHYISQRPLSSSSLLLALIVRYFT